MDAESLGTSIALLLTNAEAERIAGKVVDATTETTHKLVERLVGYFRYKGNDTAINQLHEVTGENVTQKDVTELAAQINRYAEQDAEFRAILSQYLTTSQSAGRVINRSYLKQKIQGGATGIQIGSVTIKH